MSLQSIMDGIDAVSLKSWKLRRHQATTEGGKSAQILAELVRGGETAGAIGA